MIGKLASIVIDATDTTRMSAFYQGLAGWAQSYADPEWITLETPDGWQIDVQHAPDHQAPQWPGQARPQQAHLDLRVPDLDASLDRVLNLGGSLLAKNDAYYTVADPAGHPMDLCRN